MQQRARLRGMGLADDAALRYALEIAGGDVQGVVELLL